MQRWPVKLIALFWCLLGGLIVLDNIPAESAAPIVGVQVVLLLVSVALGIGLVVSSVGVLVGSAWGVVWLERLCWVALVGVIAPVVLLGIDDLVVSHFLFVATGAESGVLTLALYCVQGAFVAISVLVLRRNRPGQLEAA